MPVKHTLTPWVVDDRHIHPLVGLTYPRGQEPETDVIVLVDTDCHANGLLNETDDVNLRFIVRNCNAHDEIVTLLEECRERLTYEVNAFGKQQTVNRITELLKQINPEIP